MAIVTMQSGKAVISKLAGPVEKAMDQAGQGLVSEVKKKINTDGYNNKRRSKPGQSPFKQTGRLQKSITCETRREGNEIVTRIGSNVKYARYLELGTRKMAPRPYLRVTLLQFKDAVGRTVIRALARFAAGP